MSPILFAVYVDSMLGRLEQSGVGCHIDEHFVGALAYADDVTLVAPSRSGIRTLINVCEQFSLDYEITFNGTKSQLLLFKGIFSNVSVCGFHVNGQYVEVSKCTMHLGHSVSSSDRTEIVKYAKSSFCSNFNIFRADFCHISSRLINILFQKYCCVFYGSPLWPLEGDMIKSSCVDWRKALRWVWSVDNRTHCYIITSLSNQVPLFWVKRRGLSNSSETVCPVKTILLKLFPRLPFVTQCLTQLAFVEVHWTVMASYLLNLIWMIISDNVWTKIDVLLDLINIREGNISCNGFTGEEINFMIYDICVNWICILAEYASFF